MATRYFALITGIFYLAIGIMGFIPAFVSHPETAPALMTDFGVASGYGYLVGIFPINGLHNLVHIAVGLGGILGYLSTGAARTFSLYLAGLYALLTIMGLLPFANTTFGLIPIFGSDVALHAVTASLAAYFGLVVAPSPTRLASKTEEYSSSAQ